MKRNQKSIIWEAGELIYSSGSDSDEAYLIVQGTVSLETSDGFRLSKLGAGEIFGETSLLLGTKRTVTAKASEQKVMANIIPKDYFTNLTKSDVVLNALIRKTQVRLIDANKKTNQLANEISDLLSSMKDQKGGQENELANRIANLKTKITEINKATND